MCIWVGGGSDCIPELTGQINWVGVCGGESVMVSDAMGGYDH